MTATETPPRVLEPWELWFGLPPVVLGNAVGVAMPALVLFGLLPALGFLGFALLVLWGIHRNHPRALAAWYRTRPQGYGGAKYRSRPVRYI